MKLKRIEIAYFGHLKNVFLQPHDRLQMIIADTLATDIFSLFIKGIFYGLTESEIETVSGLRADPLFADMKWIGHGNVVFEYDDKRYRIERYFGRRSHYDKYRVTCDGEVLRIPIRQPALTPGEHIFKVTESEFAEANLLKPLGDREDRQGEADGASESVHAADIRLMDDPERAESVIADRLDRLIGPDGAHGKAGEIRDEVREIRNDLRRRYRHREQLETLTEQRDRMAGQINELSMREDKLTGYRELHNRLTLIKRFERWKRLNDHLAQGNDISEQSIARAEAELAEADGSDDGTQAGKPYPGAKELSNLMYLRTAFGKTVSEYKVAYNQAKQKERDFEATREDAKQAINRIVTERTRLERMDRAEQERAARPESEPGFTRDIPQGIVIAAIAIGILWLVLSFVVRAKVPVLSYILLVLAVIWPFLCYLAYKRHRESERRKHRRKINAARRQRVDKLEMQNRLRELDWELEHLQRKLNDIEAQIAQYQTDLEPKAEKVEEAFDHLTYNLKGYGLEDDANVRDVDILLHELRERAMSEKTLHQRLASLQTEADDIIGDLTPEEFEEDYDRAQAWIKEHQAELGTFPPLTTFEIDRNLQNIRDEKRVRAKHVNDMSREIERLEEESLHSVEDDSGETVLPKLQTELENLEREALELKQLRAWFNIRRQTDSNPLPRLIADPSALDGETDSAHFLTELKQLAENRSQQWMIFSREKRTIEAAKELALYLDQLT